MVFICVLVDDDSCYCMEYNYYIFVFVYWQFLDIQDEVFKAVLSSPNLPQNFRELLTVSSCPKPVEPKMEAIANKWYLLACETVIIRYYIILL